jgi:DNA repair protein RadC
MQKVQKMSKILKPDYIGHRKRIKEKYKKGGLNGWLDYEVLEFALSYSIPRKDTKPMAKELLAKFKSINGVLDANIENLEKVSGVSEHTALFLNFLKDIAIVYLESGLYDRDLLSSPEFVYNYLKAALKGSHDEEFRVLFLNNQNRLIAVETIQTGTVDAATIYPRKVVERTLYNHANGVIIAHNHPGTSLRPSKEDIAITKLIRGALTTIGAELVDHIIIGGHSYYSFRENNC